MLAWRSRGGSTTPKGGETCFLWCTEPPGEAGWLCPPQLGPLTQLPGAPTTPQSHHLRTIHVPPNEPPAPSPTSDITGVSGSIPPGHSTSDSLSVGPPLLPVPWSDVHTGPLTLTTEQEPWTWPPTPASQEAQARPHPHRRKQQRGLTEAARLQFTFRSNTVAMTSALWGWGK